MKTEQKVRRNSIKDLKKEEEKGKGMKEGVERGRREGGLKGKEVKKYKCKTKLEMEKGS
jgi:hypothetical protein